MDLRNPVMAGHSLGGATTLNTLATEKRFRYIITYCYYIKTFLIVIIIFIQNWNSFGCLDVSITRRDILSL